MNSQKITKKYRKINNLPVLQYSDQQQPVHTNQSQIVSDTRAGVHMSGPANSVAYSQSAQRQFENQQNVAMMASSNSNI